MEKFFIERINIFGNNVTRESVIRNQIEIDEGDPFNEILYNKSLNNIKALNFFESVEGNVTAGNEFNTKIIDILIQSKQMNPIIYFDELDKVSESPKGDEVIGLLTHLTDVTQNNCYHDKYFSEIDFDLSKVLYIFSYNDENKINPILRDRMYNIELKGYTVDDKLSISKRYILPKIRSNINFTEEDIIFTDEIIKYIIKNYTDDEEGVRNLKRCYEIIYTKLNLLKLLKSDNEEMYKLLNITNSTVLPLILTNTIVDNSGDTIQTETKNIRGIKVCNEGGDIQIGDFLVTSSREGYFMKQADDILRSYTAAKAGQIVNFGTDTERSEIYCIMLCG